MVEIDVRERGPTFEISTNTGLEEMDVNLKDVLPGLFGQRTRKRKMRVAEAAEYLVQEEEQKLIDMDQVTRVALDRVERNGIVFLDEIDKIAGARGRPRTRRQPRRRQREYFAHRGRHHGEHAPRICADGSHPFRRGRRISCVEAQRFNPELAGPFPDRWS